MSKARHKGWRLVRSAALAVMFSAGSTLPLAQGQDGTRLANRLGEEPPRQSSDRPSTRRPEA